MKKLLKNVKGFTMIELLIVIAVLGVLAVAVLSAINPIEQINRGRDTGTRSDAEQLLSAIDRYNALRQVWPWQDTVLDPAALVWQQVTALTPKGSKCAMTDNLSSNPLAPVGCTAGADEVKASFITRITSATANPLAIEYQGGSGQSVYVCFNPQSGAFAKQGEDQCANAPADYPAAACPGAGPDCAIGAVVGRSHDCVCLP